MSENAASTGGVAMADAGWMAALERGVETSRTANHPLLERAARGEFDRAQFARFGAQHQALVGVFTRYLELLLLATDDSSQKLWLAKVLVDEYGEGSGGHDHAAMYARFLASVGVSRDAQSDAPLVREAWQHVGAHLELCRAQPFLVGLGAFGPAHEWAIPTMFGHLIAGLDAAGIGLDEREYFDLHTEQDQDHGAWMAEAMAQLATDEDTREQVRAGARFSLALRGELWDAIERVMDGADPSADSPGTARDLRAATEAWLRGTSWPVELPSFD